MPLLDRPVRRVRTCACELVRLVARALGCLVLHRIRISLPARSASSFAVLHVIGAREGRIAVLVCFPIPYQPNIVAPHSGVRRRRRRQVPQSPVASLLGLQLVAVLHVSPQSL